MEIEQFLREYKPIRSECTRKSYRGFLATFELFLNDNNLSADTVQAADIERFAGFVKGRYNSKTGTSGLSDVAVQSHLAAVSSYYQWRRCRNKKLHNPVAAVTYRRHEPQSKKPLIDPDLVTAMGEQTESELGNLVVKLLRGSGMRLSELVSLKRRNLKIDRRKGKKPSISVKVKGKGGKTRIVLIGAKAAAALINYLRRRGDDSEPALILSSRKRGISRRTVQRLVHEAAAKVGAGHCHPHALRHRFATDAIERHLPDKQLKKLLGQVSLEHTYRYIHLTEDGVEQGFEQAMKKIDKRATRVPRVRAKAGRMTKGNAA